MVSSNKKNKEMRFLLLILITISINKTSFCQFVTLEDSLEVNCKIYKGKIKSNKLEGGGGNYTVTVSKYFSFIEISALYWRTIIVKYRLENNPSLRSFFITKSMYRENNTLSSYYFAIDSSTAKVIKKEKRSLKNSNNAKIYNDLTEMDYTILNTFFEIINQHNLVDYYPEYDPQFLAGWLRVSR